MTRVSFIVFAIASTALLTLRCTRPPSPIDRSMPHQQHRPAELIVTRVVNGPIFDLHMKDPEGLAVDDRGILYLCDAGNNRILKFGSDLTPLKELGGFGSEPGMFNLPRFVTIDNRLNIWVTDLGNRRVIRLDSDLKYVDEVRFRDEADPLKFGTPSGAAATIYGVLWTADREKNRIACFDNVGRFDRFIGDFGYSGGQLSHPEKIIIGSHDEYIVCDPGNRRLIMYDSFGNFTGTLEDPRFESPVSSASDHDGNLWVLDQKSARLMLFDRNKGRVLEAGPRLNGDPTPLREPTDVAVSPDGRVIIADSGNNRLVICEVIFAAP